MVAPGQTVVFYDPAHAHLGRHLVRFAFCKRDEVLDEALTRLQSLRRPPQLPH